MHLQATNSPFACSGPIRHRNTPPGLQTAYSPTWFLQPTRGKLPRLLVFGHFVIPIAGKIFADLLWRMALSSGGLLWVVVDYSGVMEYEVAFLLLFWGRVELF